MHAGHSRHRHRFLIPNFAMCAEHRVVIAHTPMCSSWPIALSSSPFNLTMLNPPIKKIDVVKVDYPMSTFELPPYGARLMVYCFGPSLTMRHQQVKVKTAPHQSPDLKAPPPTVAPSGRNRFASAAACPASQPFPRNGLDAIALIAFICCGRAILLRVLAFSLIYLSWFHHSTFSFLPFCGSHVLSVLPSGLTAFLYPHPHIYSADPAPGLRFCYAVPAAAVAYLRSAPSRRVPAYRLNGAEIATGINVGGLQNAEGIFA